MATYSGCSSLESIELTLPGSSSTNVRLSRKDSSPRRTLNIYRNPLREVSNSIESLPCENVWIKRIKYVFHVCFGGIPTLVVWQLSATPEKG